MQGLQGPGETIKLPMQYKVGKLGVELANARIGSTMLTAVQIHLCCFQEVQL